MFALVKHQLSSFPLFTFPSMFPFLFPFYLLNSGLGSRISFMRLRLLIFFQAAPAPDFFSQLAPAPVFFLLSSGSGSKGPKACGSTIGKVWQNICSPTNYKCKTARNIKQVE